MCSGVSFYGLKCTKTHVRASVVQKKNFRLANARHSGTGRGQKGEGTGKEGREEGGRGGEGREREEGRAGPPHSRKVIYAPVHLVLLFCFFTLSVG
jgi:hypothetical protein